MQRNLLRYWRPLAVFVAAFGIRLIYSLVFIHDSASVLSQDKVLQSGQELAKLISLAHSPGELFSILTRAPAPGAPVPGLPAVDISDQLIQNLLGLGPVYIGYIALATLIFKGTASTGLESYYVAFSIVDSLLGALTALLVYYAGRLAFERRAAFTAGLLFAFYPASVVVTGLVRSESLLCLLVVFWICLCLLALLRHLKFVSRVFIYLGLGILSALLFLLNPVLIVLPVVVAFAFISLLVLPKVEDLSQRAKEAGKQAELEKSPAKVDATAAGDTTALPTESAQPSVSTADASEQSVKTSAAQTISKSPDVGTIKLTEEQAEEGKTEGAEAEGKDESSRVREGESAPETLEEANEGKESSEATETKLEEDKPEDMSAELKPAKTESEQQTEPDEKTDASQDECQEAQRKPEQDESAVVASQEEGSEQEAQAETAQEKSDDLQPQCETSQDDKPSESATESSAEALESFEPVGEIQMQGDSPASSENAQSGTDQAQAAAETQAEAETQAGAQTQEPATVTAPAARETPVAAAKEAGTVDDDASALYNRFILLCASFVAGVTLVIYPWVRYASVFGNNPFAAQEQSLSGQLLYGSQISADGWKLIPSIAYYAEGFMSVMHRFLGSLVINPVHYTELLLRKVPRLWSGSWNDYQQSFFGLPPGLQNVWHELLLFTAWIGLSILMLRYKRWRRSRSIQAACVLVCVPICYFAHVVFSPVSKDAFSAMPAVILLAAFGLVRVLDVRRSRRLEAVAPFVAAAVLFYFLQAHANVIPLIMAALPNGTVSLIVSRIGDCLVWLAGWAVLLSLTLGLLSAITNKPGTIASDIIKYAFAWIACLTVVWAAFDADWQSWFAEVKNSRQSIEQQIYIPPLSELSEIGSEDALPKTIFVLVDVESPIMAPPLRVTVNGVPAKLPPIPWLQIRSDDIAIAESLSHQGAAMGKDPRSLRQWWACAVPCSALRFGAENDISVSIVQSSILTTFKFFGTYSQPTPAKIDPYKPIPSLYYISTDKGFATFDNVDPRILESLMLSGTVTGCSIAIGDDKQRNDLSFVQGRQTGMYNVRIALPNSTVWGLPANADLPVTRVMIADLPLYLKDEGFVALGSDPLSTLVTQVPVHLPGDLPSQSVLSLTCELSSANPTGEASISVLLSGYDESGKQIHYASAWQPDVTPVTGEWHPFNYCQVIPDSILRLRDLTAQIYVSPCQPSLAVARPDWARQQSVNCRMLRLTVLPPLNIPPEGERDWIVF